MPNPIVNRRLVSQGSVPPNAIVEDWVSRLVSHGGAVPSQNTIQAMDSFVNGCTDDGTYNLLISWIPLVPDNLIAAISPCTNIVGPNDPWTNTNFVSGDLNINGLIGDGATKFLTPGISPSALTTNDTSLILYESSISTAGNDCGSQNPVPQNAFTLYPDAAGTTYFDAYNFVPGQGRNSVAASGLNGYYCGSRTAANSSNIYFANSTHSHASISSIATSGGSLPTGSILFFALNNGGSAFGFSSSRISFAAIAKGLTSANSEKLFNRIQAFRQKLGGGFA